MKTVLLLPGSRWQIPIVKKVKKMGHRVLVVNPIYDSPAFKYADGWLQSDIFDKEKCLAFCKKQKVDAVVSDECDIAMPMVAFLSETMGLTSISSKSARLYTDKYEMRKNCMKNGFNCPEFFKCRNIEEAITFFTQLQSKAIIKPLDSNSSRGVYIINNVDDILTNFEQCLSYSKSEKAVIVEEYIEGTQFTVDGIKTPNRHYSLTVSIEKTFSNNESIPCELNFVNQNSEFDFDILREQNDAYVESTGLEFGLTHAEYKCKGGKYYLIEIGARGGGNFLSSYIVPFMSGVDNHEYLINCSLGNIGKDKFKIAEKCKKRVSTLKFFDVTESNKKVAKIKGIDYLESEKDVVAYRFNCNPGDIVQPAANGAERKGFCIICSERKGRRDQILEKISKRVKIELI